MPRSQGARSQDAPHDAGTGPRAGRSAALGRDLLDRPGEPGHPGCSDPTWREFNRRIRDNGDMGIYHETYVVDRYEAIYANMPADFGLAGATALVQPDRRGQRAAHRLDPAEPDTPVLQPY